MMAYMDQYEAELISDEALSTFFRPDKARFEKERALWVRRTYASVVRESLRHTKVAKTIWSWDVVGLALE